MLKHRLVPIAIFGITVTVLAVVLWTAQHDRSTISPGQGELPTATAQVRGKTFHVGVAASPAAREIGLSGTDSLPEDRGMLFLYDKPDYYQYWMKGMKFPLDIIFIRESTIISIARSVPPPTGDGELPRYAPAEPADKVLEINAGLSDKYGIKEGDTVTITIP